MTEPADVPAFLVTKEYRRFAEFCDACRRYRYIGLCHGPPGVGKTFSARHYARWEEAEPAIRRAWHSESPPPLPEVADRRTLCYTVSLTTTTKRLEQELYRLLHSLNLAVAAACHPELDHLDRMERYLDEPARTELVVVDEADRLKFPVLEQLRHLYDQCGFGLVLIGMPGLEKRLARYAQLYSRVGFVHQFRPLSTDELRLILERKWQELGLSVDLSEFDDVEAMSAILRNTGGNFRLVQRLFAQVARIMEINHLQRLTKAAVDAARESLVIGPS